MADTKRVDLNGRKLFIGIPCYDGKVNVKTAFSIAQLMPMAAQLGIKVYLSDLSNCSIITMARNALVAEFLRTDATELLFIDSDVVVKPDDILRLMAQSGDKDITAGAYPRRLKEKKFFADVYWTEDGGIEMEGSLLRVERVGTGFMLIQRHVLEQMVAAHPEWKYEDRRGPAYAVFDFQLKGDHYMGEDYLFCDRAREMGFKVYIDSEISLPHIGQMEFTSDFAQEVMQPLLEAVYKAKLKVANG